jgi:hypothetical protein
MYLILNSDRLENIYINYLLTLLYAPEKKKKNLSSQEVYLAKSVFPLKANINQVASLTLIRTLNKCIYANLHYISNVRINCLEII